MDKNELEIPKPKFKVMERIIYRNGDTYELGIIKEVILKKILEKQHLRQDGLHGEPTGDLIITYNYAYRVLYNGGSTSALTNEEDLNKITNSSSFKIDRKTTSNKESQSVDEPQMTELKNLIKDIHQTAIEHGWWDKPKKFSTIISLIHSELSEALEFERNKQNLINQKIDHLYHYTGTVDNTDIKEDLGDEYVIKPTELMSNIPNDICKKPDGVLPELADVIIRVFDYIGSLDMEDEFINIILKKHQFNKTRSHLHGGKQF